MKIVMLEAKTVSCGDVSFDEIYRLGEVTEYPLTPDDKIVERIGDAEAVLCNKTPFTESVLRACPKLKYIGVCATGYTTTLTLKLPLSLELQSAMCRRIQQKPLHSRFFPIYFILQTKLLTIIISFMTAAG
jgi:hypothetical protein